jgi:nitrogen fixation protein FixH
MAVLSDQGWIQTHVIHATREQPAASQQVRADFSRPVDEQEQQLANLHLHLAQEFTLSARHAPTTAQQSAQRKEPLAQGSRVNSRFADMVVRCFFVPEACMGVCKLTRRMFCP